MNLLRFLMKIPLIVWKGPGDKLSKISKKKTHFHNGELAVNFTENSQTVVCSMSDIWCIWFDFYKMIAQSQSDLCAPYNKCEIKKTQSERLWNLANTNSILLKFQCFVFELGCNII